MVPDVRPKTGSLPHAYRRDMVDGPSADTGVRTHWVTQRSATPGTTTCVHQPPPTTAGIPVVSARPVVQTALCRSIGEVDEVIGSHGAAAHCWCQADRLSGVDLHTLTPTELRSRLAARIAQDSPAPGVIASIGGERVGWCSVAPRAEFVRARSCSAMSVPSTQPDDPAVWSVTCFVVRAGFRRRGVATALLDAAVEHARSSGAGWLEGYPADTSERSEPEGDSLHRGTLHLFQRAGFELVARPRHGRAIVRLEL